MARRRELKLDDYGISLKRYKELKAFCEQYPEWMEQMKFVKNNETGRINKEKLRRKCEIVEQAAIEASADLYPFIIKSVCYEAPMWKLRDIEQMPCSGASFYDVRRYFFSLLNKRRD